MKAPLRAAATILVTALITLTAACTPPPAPTDYSTCPTPAAGEVRVAVVVDASAAPGGASTPSVVCVAVPSGSTGMDALFERAERIGTAPPRLGGGGLVCAIDGEPAAPACGESGPNGFRFWGYYLGGASWGFAPVGPGGRTVTDGSVEGWSFQDGPGGPPATASSFAALTS
jgi:hypothetical protein